MLELESLSPVWAFESSEQGWLGVEIINLARLLSFTNKLSSLLLKGTKHIIILLKTLFFTLRWCLNLKAFLQSEHLNPPSKADLSWEIINLARLLSFTNKLSSLLLKGTKHIIVLWKTLFFYFEMMLELESLSAVWAFESSEQGRLIVGDYQLDSTFTAFQWQII